jgi:molybdenum cofactor cytidylyltransferase
MKQAIGGVILAAGGSTRMGQLKQLLIYQGCSLIRRAAMIAISSVCRPVVVVVGANCDCILPELDGLEVAIAINNDWSHGMSTSLQVGISALLAEDAEIAAVVLMVCDQPFVSTELINQLVSTYQDSTNYSQKPVIVAAQYGVVVGVPALFDRSVFPAFTALQGDTGARAIIRHYGAQVRSIPFPAGAIDIDTPTDYENLV